MPWLKGQLELKGFTVAAPAMPRTEAPAIGAWISHLRREVGETGEAAYYVGHSIGCQTIIRHLEQLPASGTARGATVLAPRVVLTHLTPEEGPLAQARDNVSNDF